MTHLEPLSHVLLVDDGDVDLIVYQRIIARTGLADTVVACNSAERALEHLREPGRAPVDLTLLDVNMPRLDGFDFLDRVAAEWGVTALGRVVIMLTTPLSAPHRARAKRHGIIDRFVDKPLSEAQFSAIVRDARSRCR
ncbi:MAG: response regulator [Pseudomonadota bacterium]